MAYSVRPGVRHHWNAGHSGPAGRKSDLFSTGGFPPTPTDVFRERTPLTGSACTLFYVPLTEAPD